MEPFIAQIVQFGGNFAPKGWAKCDGQLLAINQYSALFSILGTTYGGDGVSSFGLPDLRSRVPMHAGSGPGLSTYRLGQKGGVEKVTLISPEIPSHNHLLSAATISGSISVGVNESSPDTEDANNSTLGKTNADDVVYNQSSATGSLGSVSHNLHVSGNTSNTGGNQSHENRQPFTCLNFIIALEGIYPSRS